ncbi:CPBP family intramembrane metalloprotease [Bacteroidales bacterium OttesenSCG-928-K22]|nr:CPBP family intramembrane metalloprotease [Bacteroidales bacterium OttesenSCG-928-K22]
MNFLERALDGTNKLGKYILIFIIFLLGYTIGCIPILIIFVKQLMSQEGLPDVFFENYDFTLLGISHNMSLLLILIPFVVAFIACIIFIKLFHSRSFAETVNGTEKLRWNRAFFAFGIWFVLLLIDFAISYALEPNNFVFQFNLKSFIPLLVIVILLVPIQTTCEELFFRGYLTQGVAAWTKNRWLAIIIPGVLFGLMHSFNAPISEYGFFVAIPYYILFGLILGFISVIDDGIELAIGIHAANNVFLFSFISDPTMPLPTVFEQISTDVNIVLMYITEVIMFGIIIFIFNKKYKWNFSILGKKLVNNKELPTE